jgi:hypothetical protein
MLAAADTVLECMASAGTSCVYESQAADAWVAQLELEQIAVQPPPLLPNLMLRAADAVARATTVDQRVSGETELAVPLTRDLSCRAIRARNVGAELEARRLELVDRAEQMGLGGTDAGAAVGGLAATAKPLARTQLVEATCKDGELYLLLSAPRTDIEPDEDPAAHAGGGWEVLLVSYEEQRLLRGAAATGTAQPIVDPVPGGVVDPWIPVTEVDL